MARAKREKNLKYIDGQDGKPGYYVTEITLNYRRVRRFAGHTKEEAKAYLSKLILAARSGELEELISPKPAADTFGEYARTLLDSAEWKQKRSYRRDETSLDALNKKFKNTPLAEIKPGAVRMYMTKRIRDDKVKPATANRELSFLKSVLYKAEYDEIIQVNPIRGRRIKRLTENNNREKQILALNLSDDRLRKLIEAGDDWFRVVLRLAITLGMRQGEILKAEWRDFNLTLRTLRVRAENAKSKEERIIPLDPELAVAIDMLPKIGQYIFSRPDGKRRRDIRKPWLAACKTAGIESGRSSGICFHDLRHYAARRLVRKTDVVTAQKILGWKTLDMVKRYVHPTDEDKRMAIEAVAADLFPIPGRQKDVNGQNGHTEEESTELVQIKQIQ
jgi:integrase